MTPIEKGGKGWRRGGYHIIIENDGSPRRVYDDNTLTNGVLSYGGVWNGNSLHISYTGGRKEGEITKQQLHTLRRAIAHFLQKYPSIKILGHNQIDEKYCPNMNVEYFCELLGVPKGSIYQEHHFPNFSRKDLPLKKSIIKALESGEEYAEDVELNFNLIAY